FRAVADGIGRDLLDLAQDSVDVDAAGARGDLAPVAAQREFEARISRNSGQPDDVLKTDPAQKIDDRALFVPVGIEVDSTLLLQDLCIALPGREAEPRKIAFH